MLAACSVTSRRMSSAGSRPADASIVIRCAGTSSPTSTGATMTAGIPATLGSHSGRWPSREARSTWPSRGPAMAARIRPAAFSAGTPGDAAAITSMTGLTTATVAAVRSAISWVTLARPASCTARPESWR